MFEVKPMSVDKEPAARAGDEVGKVCVSGAGVGDSVYLYEGQDWSTSLSCSPDEPSAISPLLAEETFRYMILSADRVEQMTKTYNDIDVVTHLLAERDRDLELAARIGQSLLQRNHILQERNESLEDQLAQTLDQMHQLQHELVKKDELLRVVASASEESETDSSCSTPLLHPVHTATAAVVALTQLETLQSKLHQLEEENQALRSEASHLKKETSCYEEKEQQLVSDCVKELRESNSQMVTLTEELSQKNEDLLRHQEEIAQLLSQIVELQHRVKELALEKEELRIHLQASKDAQRQLTAELKELADRNVECVGMLHESQEEIKELRSKSTPSAGLRRHLPYGLYPMESLAAEIEGTMRRELSVEEEMAFEDQRLSHRRVFQTVRSVKEAAAVRAAAPPIPGSGHCGLVMTTLPCTSSHIHNTDRDDPQPSSPRGGELSSALQRLCMRRHNLLSEHLEAERDRKLQKGMESHGGVSGSSSPMGSHISSFTNLSELSMSSGCFKTFLPEKLQIVKPMEGSLTLHHWQQLAKPHLATILDLHPGVVTKGFRPLPLDPVYRLSDPEEDEERDKLAWERGGSVGNGKREEEEEEEGITFRVHSSSTLRGSPAPASTTVTLPTSSGPSLSSAAALPVSQPSVGMMVTPAVNPGKCQSSTFSTYTFTTCRILHPSDITQVTPSTVCSPSLSERTPSSLRTGPSTPVTPCRLSLADSFPARRPTAPPGGLAKLLLERGISAHTTPAGPLPAPPATPPNSPSHSPYPSPIPAPSCDNFLASRPAELFLQDVYRVKLGRAPRSAPPALAPTPEPASAHCRDDLLSRLRRLGLDKALLGGACCRDSSTFLATGGRSLLDGLRRNQSLPAMIGRRSDRSASSPSHLAPPPHPTSLAIPSPPWGDLKPRPTRRHASLSQAPPLTQQQN